MAKKKATGGVNKSEFIRNALTKDPNLSLQQTNELWSKGGAKGASAPCCSIRYGGRWA